MRMSVAAQLTFLINQRTVSRVNQFGIAFLFTTLHSVPFWMWFGHLEFIFVAIPAISGLIVYPVMMYLTHCTKEQPTTWDAFLPEHKWFIHGYLAFLFLLSPIDSMGMQVFRLGLSQFLAYLIWADPFDFRLSDKAIVFYNTHFKTTSQETQNILNSCASRFARSKRRAAFEEIVALFKKQEDAETLIAEILRK